MTTYTFTGFFLNWTIDDDLADAGIATFEVVAPMGASFYYELGKSEPGGLPDIEIIGPVNSIHVNDTRIDGLDMRDFGGTVSWGADQQTTLLGITVVGAYGKESTEYLFRLAGDPLPDINTAADFDAFQRQITGLQPATGAYGEQTELFWDNVPGVSTTEDDVLFGWEGPEVLRGEDGNDRFVGSEAADVLRGGRGFDEVDYSASPNPVFVYLSTGQASDGWSEEDMLYSIEAVRGSTSGDADTGDVLNGSDRAEAFRGLTGADRILGKGGSDIVKYDLDATYGGTDGVVVNLTRGFAIDGFGHRDQLAGIERAQGTEQADTLTGDAETNMLRGDGGNDTLRGRAGDDRLVGGTGRDRLFGDRGDDGLVGDGGMDVLRGGAGRDTLNGGTGDDLLVGGKGPDRFVFEAGFGQDTLRGFNADYRLEKIDLRKIDAITDMADLRASHMTQQGEDVVIRVGKNSITIEDMQMSDLNGDDFLF